MKTFTRFINRKDRALTGFIATDPAEQPSLLRDICSNATTAHIRQLTLGGAVNVPNHAADKVEAHILQLGWSRESAARSMAAV
jgi:hypothetical protein